MLWGITKDNVVIYVDLERPIYMHEYILSLLDLDYMDILRQC